MGFPRGIDSDQLRRLQEQAENVRRMEARDRAALNKALGGPSTRRAIRDAMRVYAEREAAWRAVGASAVEHSLRSVMRTLNSPGFRAQMEGVIRAAQAAQNRLGADGILAAQYAAPSGIVTRPSFRSGYEGATGRIGEGRADEVLEEAAELAASPEILETVENADKEKLVEAAGERAAQEDVPLQRGAVRAGIDVESVIAAAEWTDAELEAMWYYAQQVLRVLVVAASVVYVGAGAGSAPGLDDILTALGGAGAVLSFIEALRERRRNA